LQLYNYKPHENSLNTSGLTFVPKFEKQNPSISINVLCSGDDGGYVPPYVSKERHRRHHVKLFLTEGPDDTRHYVWIKNMSRLVAGSTKTHCPAFVCNHCLYPFSSKQVHDSHVPNCQRHPAQDVKYPDPKKPKESVLEFRKYAARFRLPFYLVCDFESFLTPIDPNEDVDVVKATNVVDEHNVRGFACHRVSEYSQYQTDPSVYSGPGVMDAFYEHVMHESKVISDILADDQDMDPLTDTQQTDYDGTTSCGECGGDFTKSNTKSNYKVRHHDHVTGQFLFPTCNNCNLTLKMPNRKRKVTQGQGPNKKPKTDKEYTKNFFLPVIFHNLKSYDAHFVIKHFKKQYTARSRTTMTSRNKRSRCPTVTSAWFR